MVLCSGPQPKVAELQNSAAGMPVCALRRVAIHYLCLDQARMATGIGSVKVITGSDGSSAAPTTASDSASSRLRPRNRAETTLHLIEVELRSGLVGVNNAADLDNVLGDGSTAGADDPRSSVQGQLCVGVHVLG